MYRLSIRPSIRHHAVVGMLATALTLAAAGCATDSAATPPTTPTVDAISPDHASADVTFAQEMVPHHEQAVTMSGLAEGRGASPAVRSLAQRIGAAQSPEIQRMRAMLATWGAPAPSGGGSMPGMPGMPGMMTDADMQQLGTVTGPAFDRMFLEMMVRHHQGAVDMARTEQAQGRNPQAAALAGSIVGAQQAEIAEMTVLLQHG